MKVGHLPFIRALWRAFENLLPDSIYFGVMQKLYTWVNSERRGSATAFHIEGDRLYCASERRFGEFRFCERTRFRFYLWPDGIEHRLSKVRKKYEHQNSKVDRGDTVIDIGANVGEFSVSVANLAGRIVAFEPDPAAFKCLEKNCASHPTISTCNIALSNETGETPFYLSTKGADSSLVEPERYTKRISVSTTTLDDALATMGITRVDFLKVEAEGWEPEILEGAADTLKHTQKIAVDAGPERKGQTTIDEVSSILKKEGFAITRQKDIVFGERRN